MEQHPTLDSLSQLVADTQNAKVHLEPMTLLVCEGPDASTFLQGQLTCDVAHLKVASENIANAVLGSCCTPQGRMMGLFHVARIKDDCYWLLLTKSNQPTVSQHLGKYSIFSKVTITHNPQKLDIYGLIRPLQIEQLKAENTAQLVVADIGQDTKYQLIYALIDPSKASSFNPKNTISAPLKLWHLAWLCLGLPKFIQSLEGTYMPSDLHLDELGGISYNKGCYTGQEPIARLHFKGVPKFTCRILTWKASSTQDDQDNLTGGVLVDGKKVGDLIQTLRIGEQWIGLAKIRIDAIKAQLQSNNISFHLENWPEPASFANLAYNEKKHAQMIRD